MFLAGFAEAIITRIFILVNEFETFSLIGFFQHSREFRVFLAFLLDTQFRYDRLAVGNQSSGRSIGLGNEHNALHDQLFIAGC